MSVILAVDPNVLIAAAEGHRHSTWALDALVERRSEFRIGIDPQSEIYKAYFENLQILKTHDATNQFVKVFLDRSNRRYAVIREAVLTRSDQEWLAEIHCDEPVEPKLIAVGRSAPGESGMLVVGESLNSTSLVGRGTNSLDVIEQLHRKYTDLQVWRVGEVRRQLDLINRSRYPGNESQLHQFLKDTETEFLEFKQPKPQDGTARLTHTIVIAALEAVCAMINSKGGRVLVGVDPEGKVIGIDPVLRNGKPDDDLLSRRFSDEFTWFDPPINQYVKPAVVPLSNGRRVVLLHVNEGEKGVRYSFDNGKSIAIYDRCGPSNRRTRVIGQSCRY